MKERERKDIAYKTSSKQYSQQKWGGEEGGGREGEKVRALTDNVEYGIASTDVREKSIS